MEAHTLISVFVTGTDQEFENVLATHNMIAGEPVSDIAPMDDYLRVVTWEVSAAMMGGVGKTNIQCHHVERTVSDGQEQLY